VGPLSVTIATQVPGAWSRWYYEMPDSCEALDLRPGELVRVRSVQEIFSTLDGGGALDNLPFMPEMLRYCGQTFTVAKRADKTCGPDHGLRRMRNTVFLSNARCDGSAHGGCQAACLLYWKEAWLARTDSPTVLNGYEAREDTALVDKTLLRSTRTDRASVSADDDVSWKCQATELPQASTRLRGWQLDQYVKDAGNWGILKVIRVLLIEAFNRAQKLTGRYLPTYLLFRGGQTYPFLDRKLENAATPHMKLGLQPGDRVRIKSKEEIIDTLDRTNHTRGLSFDAEMVKYCGRIATVRARVNRLIDEETGKMVKIKSDCIILEGVTCTADYHRLCPRGIYPYWREAWLERIT
jgi:hypothetical protein